MIDIAELEDADPVKESPFQNCYGCFELVKTESNEFYLRMGDCPNSDDFYGPLEQKHIDAFNTLCELKDVMD
ncbi:MAG: hypothetical protein OXE99_00155 [Cellvibrionales bacterium]|nr:hypothetical protein [Cellvibrionales bacterium]